MYAYMAWLKCFALQLIQKQCSEKCLNRHNIGVQSQFTLFPLQNFRFTIDFQQWTRY